VAQPGEGASAYSHRSSEPRCPRVVGAELLSPPTEVPGVVSCTIREVRKDVLGVAVNEVCQDPLRCLLADQVPSSLDGGFVLLGPPDSVGLPIEDLGLSWVGGHAPAPALRAAVGRQ
jgi:hypothetical protein